MQLQQTVVYLLVIAITPAHLFPHRSSRHLNLEQPTESTAATTAIKNAETGSSMSLSLSLSSSPLSTLMDAQQWQQRMIQDKRDGSAAVRSETLNSPSAAFVLTSTDDYRKPAFVQHMKQFMENSKTDIVYVIDDDDNGKSKRTRDVVDVTKRSDRNGRQFYPIVALDIEPTPKPTVSTGPGFFSIMPIAFDWRQTFSTPFAAIYAPATAQSPLRIWAIGSVAKFPPFIEHFVQRIQAHYSVYKYEDLSRPGYHHSGSTDQVVRVSTPSKKPTPIADVTDAATKFRNDETTGSTLSITTSTASSTTTIATTTSKA